MSEECSKLFGELSFDKLSMEGSLADSFFKKNKKKFGSQSQDKVTDILGNQIWSCVDTGDVDKWFDISHKYKQAFFIDLGQEIKRNIQLFAEIDYFVRGIPVCETKTHLSDVVEVCNLIANRIPFSSQWHSYFEDYYSEITPTYFMSNSSSVLILLDVLYNLAAHREVKIYAENNTAVFIHHFQTLIKNCDKKQRLRTVGPFFYKENPVKDTILEGSAMIVCKGGDLDSAVATVIKGAWSYRGLLPYSLKRILVQDNIWDQFVKKLSKKVEEFKWDLPDNYKPDEMTLTQKKHVNNIMQKAKTNGQTVLKMNKLFYESENNKTHLKPLVILDEMPYFWQELPKDVVIPVVTLQPFRTSKEALLLLNKVPLDYLTIWCNNVSICNEISMRVNIPHVWINSFGLFNYSLISEEKIYRSIFMSLPRVLSGSVSELPMLNRESALKNLSKISKQWLTFSTEKRLRIVYDVVEEFEENKSSLISKIKDCSSNITDHAIESEIEKCRELVQCFAHSSNVSEKDNKLCMHFKRPIGTVYIVKSYHSPCVLIPIIGAILYGNTVLYEDIHSFVVFICDIFLKHNIPVGAVDSRDMKDFPAEQTILTCLPFHDIKFNSNVFTKSNFIWCTFGESFYDGKMLNITS